MRVFILWLDYLRYGLHGQQLLQFQQRGLRQLAGLPVASKEWRRSPKHYGGGLRPQHLTTPSDDPWQ